MAINEEQLAWFSETFEKMADNVGQSILGKKHVVQLVLTAMLSEGHVLLEDFPGTGKTSLARAITQTVSGVGSRVQFTPDLLPGDLTGITVYDQKNALFEFHKGPLFANIVLADEINRASPKTQSALLEVMEEGQVTVDGQSRKVGQPFLVIATQNPIEQAGTYRLPEAQLDRFLLKTSLGYPDRATTVQILEGTAQVKENLSAIVSPQVVLDMIDLARQVYVNPIILDYIARLIDATRHAAQVLLGSSVRGAMALTRASKTWAAAHGRNYVIPDDVKNLAPAVLSHRIVLDTEAEFDGVTAESIIAQILLEIEPPVQSGSA